MHPLASKSRLVLAVLVLSASGCGGAGNIARAPAPSFDGRVSESVLLVVVHNQQLDEARVTAWADGTRRRLGTVQANSEREFRVPLNTVSMVRLEFDITLGATCVTRSVQLGPGDIVDVTIPPRLEMMDAICRR